ncbi:MAG TPA: ABC transporter ATP-binding protein [Kiritimatiellia bacterium]|nr:ABC transporter ATP-binding protein [Kiritimatiellia bacterium]
MRETPDELIEVKDLWVVYGKGEARVEAVKGIGFKVKAGELVGLVGESGCGKTSTGRCLVGLETPTQGTMMCRGRAVSEWLGRSARAYRRKVQMVFQDPMGSLNPRMTIGASLGEVLQVHGLPSVVEGRRVLDAALEDVGLPPDLGLRYPHEVSGGQRQRVGLARALLLEPDVIIADEPVSALDVSVQAQILRLIRELRERRGTAFLFIAHDLAAVRSVCDRILVMSKGEIVEEGPTEEVFENPRHPYTRMLLESVPDPGRFDPVW